MSKLLKKMFIPLLTVFFTLSLFGNLVQAKEYTIKDVPKTDSAYEQIQWVLNQGYMGLIVGKFLPNSNIKRNEFTVILSKVNGDVSNLIKPSKPTFLDVKANDQFYKYIETEKSNMNFFKSAKGKIFKPTTYLTREDACMSVVKAMGYDNDDSAAYDVDSDVSLDEVIQDAGKISPSMMKYVTLAVKNELIELRENGDNSFMDPKKNITRRQLAVFIYNAYQNMDINKSDDSTSTDDGSTSYTNDNTSLDTSSSTSSDYSTVSKSNAKLDVTIAEKAVSNAEIMTDADVYDLVGIDSDLTNAQAAITEALELVVKLDNDSSDYKGFMARIDTANSKVVKAMNEKDSKKENNVDNNTTTNNDSPIVTTTIAADGSRVDKIDYPFVNDNEIIGKWEYMDFVNNIKDFNTLTKRFKGALFLKSVTFEDQGSTSWQFAEDAVSKSHPSCKWTKGIIIDLNDITASHYIINKIDNVEYLFMEWKSGDYVIRGTKPGFYVLKRSK